MTTTTDGAELVSVSRERAAAMVGVSFETIKRAVNSGALRAKRVGGTSKRAGRILIGVTDLRTWFDELDDAI